MPSSARPDELDAVVALIAAEQQDVSRAITYVGEQVDGIRAELDDLEPDWRSSVRVVHDESGALVGAALAEWSTVSGRAWVLGPWVAGTDRAWDQWARRLFDAAVSTIPAAITDRELSGTVENIRLASLASDVGWPPSEINYAFVLDAERAGTWTVDTQGADGLRSAVGSDLAAINALHEAEFPASYFSAPDLLTRAANGEQVVVVIEGADGVAGYAAGRVQADGEGYIDFVAVDPAARGGGYGRRLVVGLARQLLPATTTGRINLTVQEHRTPARALYSSLGFRVDLAFRGYRSRSAS